MVIAVSEFSDDNMRNGVLKDSIEKATHELEDYFRTNFPDAELHICRSLVDTAAGSIRELFRGNFKKWAEGNVTLLFIISHGKAIYNPKSPLYKRDLLIYTSDTLRSNPEANGILASELIQAFKGIDPPSIVLTFLDTCQAGAAQNLDFNIEAAHLSGQGVKMMMMGSSLSEGISEKAVFTSALVKVWKDMKPDCDCTTPEVAEDSVKQSLQSLLKDRDLGPTEGKPHVMIHYLGRLCLESFAAHSAMIALFNPSSTDLVADILPTSGKKCPSFQPTLVSGDVTPIRLDRTTYNVRILAADGMSVRTDLPEPLDLREKHVQFYPLGKDIPLAKLGAASEKAGDYAYLAGMEQHEVQALWQQASEYCVAANDRLCADRILAKLTPQSKIDQIEVAKSLPSSGSQGPPISSTVEERGILGEFKGQQHVSWVQSGQSSGSVIQVNSKSGSKQLHGTGFGFFQNDAFDAKNFFDRRDTGIPLLRRNYFGGDVGGPVIKDKGLTFFFIHYEGLRERNGETQAFITPTAGSRVGAAPEIVPYLVLYPLPNDPGSLDLGDGTGVHKTSAVRRTGQDNFLIRLDQKVGQNDMLTAQYLFGRADSFNPFLSTPVPGFESVVVSRNHFFTLAEEHRSGSRLANAFRVFFNRFRYEQNPTRINPGLSLALGPVEKPMGLINVGGLPPLGHALTVSVDQAQNEFEFLNNLTYSQGKHTLRVGLDGQRTQLNGPFDFAANGSYTFFSLADFLAGNVGFFLGTSGSSPDSTRGYRQTGVNTFAQDTFLVTKDFTLNLGLRYEYKNSPSEQNNRLANIRNPLTDTSTTLGKIFDAPSPLFAPRLGVAWDIHGSGKSVLKGGVGIFYDQIGQNIYGGTRWLPPFYQLVLGGFGPGTFRNLATIQPSGFNMPVQSTINQPYSLSYNVEIQRQLNPVTVLTVSYVGTRGNHLLRRGESNPTQFTIVNGQKFFPNRLGLRLNPHFGSVQYIVTDAQSFFNSLQLAVLRQQKNGLMFRASYIFAKSIDDASDPLFSNSAVQDFFSRQDNRSLSTFDIRHNFTFTATYELPLGKGRTFGSGFKGVAGRLIEGWDVGGFFKLSSGVPFTVLQADNRSQNGAIFFADRPNTIPDRHCSITGDPARWLDPTDFSPAAPGFYGNAGRNICRGPDFRNVDISILKNTHIIDGHEHLKMQFRAEFFNLSNHPNFETPTNTFNNPYGGTGNGDAVFSGTARLASAGRIFRTVNTSRQIQFGIKVLF